MKKIYSILLCFFTVYAVNAQQYVHQAIFLNEGYFNMETNEQEVPVSIGSYNPSTGVYSDVAEIEGARFASDIMIEDEILYVAADNRLIKYDLNTFEILQEVNITGIRDIAIKGNLIVISKGEYFEMDNFLEVRNVEDLSLIQEFYPGDGPSYAAEDIKIRGNKAYIAVGNSFEWGNYVGILGVLDLDDFSYVETDLGEDALNPEHIVLTDDEVYLFCNNNYDFSSIARVGQDVSLIASYAVATNSSCGTSARIANKFYYQEYSLDKLAVFDLLTHTIVDTLENTIAFYSIVDDPVNEVIYASSTNFVNSGTGYIVSYEGEILEQFPAGVSAGNIVLDIRGSVSVDEMEPIQASVFPNPSNDFVYLNTPGLKGKASVSIFDITGRKIQDVVISGESSRIELTSLSTGLYVFEIKTENGSVTRTVVKN